MQMQQKNALNAKNKCMMQNANEKLRKCLRIK